MNIIKIEIEQIEPIPIPNTTLWCQKLFKYCLCKLIEEENSTGAIYAELVNPNVPIKFYISNDKEMMLNKKYEKKVLIELKIKPYLDFLSYLNKEVCKSMIGTMGCCIIEAKYNYKNDVSYFTLYSRKSAYLTSFWQLDMFKDHL